MNDKDLGLLGEIKVIAYLVEKGYSVFKQVGEGSRIDIIAVDNHSKIITIQVKSISSIVKGFASLKVRKTKSRNEYRYNVDDFDYFALYIYPLDKIAFIESEEIGNNRTSVSFRINRSNNNQKKKIRMLDDYLDIK